MSLVIEESPNSKVIELDIPTVIPTPTDSLGLKYALSFAKDSK